MSCFVYLLLVVLAVKVLQVHDPQDVEDDNDEGSYVVRRSHERFFDVIEEGSG